MRKLVIAVLVLVVLVAALSGWALYNVDSVIASYKDRIVAAAERRTGRTVAFDRIAVRFRGGIVVRISGLSLAEDPAFGAGHFLQAPDVRLNLRLHPLKRRISITRVRLGRPVVRIMRDARGVYNFSSLGSRMAATRRSSPWWSFPAVSAALAAPAGPESPSRPGGLAGLAVDLAVERVEVSGGTVSYRGHGQQRQLELRKWDLGVDGLTTDRPFRAELAAAFLSDTQNLRFNGLVGPLGRRPRADAVPVDGSLDIARLSWQALRRALPWMDRGWPKTLDLAGNLKAEGVAVKGTLAELDVAGTLDLTDSGLKYAGVLNKPRSMVLRIGTEARVTAGGIAAKRLDATLDRVALKGRGDLDFGSPATLDLSLKTGSTELGGLHRWAPVLAGYGLSGRASATVEVAARLDGESVPRIHGTAAFRKASARIPAWDKRLEKLSAAVEFSDRRATFRQLSVRIGRTRLVGRVTLESLAPLAMTYRLASPSLRLQDLGLRPEGAVLEGARGSGRLGRRGGPSWEGSLTAARGVFLGLDVADVAMRFAVRRPWLVIGPLRFKTLGGWLDGNGRMQTGGAAPRFEAAGRLRGIDVRQSLAGIAGFPDVEGAMDADFNVAGQGRTWKAVKPTLTGTARAAVTGGRVLDFSLGERELQGITGVKGLTALFSRGIRDKYPHIFGTETAAFQHIDTELRAAAGKIVVNRVTLTARDYDIASNGWVGLDGETNLDGLLTVSEDLSSDLLPGSRPTPVTNDKGEIEVPFTLRGTIPALKLRPRLEPIPLRTLLGISVRNGVQGLLDAISGADSNTRRKETGEGGTETPKKLGEADTDPILKLIERALKPFRSER